MIIRGADVGAGRQVDVRLTDGVVADLAPRLRPTDDDEIVEAQGGALIPGLHDHHIHLFALAASMESVPCGNPGFATAIRRDPGASWVRGVGYHESVAGPLDRWRLDAIEAVRPVRIQHRSGALWVVNSAGAAHLGLDTADEPGIERDAGGVPTGRLWRLDGWLRRRIGAGPVDLGAAGRLLSGFGITGVTDATPDLAPEQVAGLPFDVQVLGRRKILLPDHDLPTFDDLVAVIRSAPRPAAVHCVTRESLVLTLAALEEAGPAPGDRIEHGSVVPPELLASLRRLGLRVVTQPAFVADRGDDYLAEVEPDDRRHLYPYASLLAAGIPTAPSSDAPFGDPDPWRIMAAARDRRTPTGQVVGPDERVAAEVTLAGFLSPLDDPGGPPRRIEVGGPADLCLLHEPLAVALASPSRDLVRRTFPGKK